MLSNATPSPLHFGPIGSCTCENARLETSRDPPAMTSTFLFLFKKNSFAFFNGNSFVYVEEKKQKTRTKNGKKNKLKYSCIVNKMRIYIISKLSLLSIGPGYYEIKPKDFVVTFHVVVVIAENAIFVPRAPTNVFY